MCLFRPCQSKDYHHFLCKKVMSAIMNSNDKCDIIWSTIQHLNNLCIAYFPHHKPTGVSCLDNKVQFPICPLSTNYFVLGVGGGNGTGLTTCALHVINVTSLHTFLSTSKYTVIVSHLSWSLLTHFPGLSLPPHDLWNWYKFSIKLVSASCQPLSASLLAL